MEEAKQVWRKEVGCMWEFPVLFPQFCCEPKPAPKRKKKKFKGFPKMELFIISSQLIKSGLVLNFSYKPS